MVDPRFFDTRAPARLDEIAAASGAELARGGPDRLIADVAPLDRAGAEHVSFLDNPKYAGQLARTGAGACFITPDQVSAAPENLALLVTARPRRAFAKAASFLHPTPPVVPGVAAAAEVAPSARIAASAAIGSNAVIGAGADIGADAEICAGAVIGPGVVIGAGTVVGAGAVVSHAVIGARGVIYPGARIGQPGFGFDADASGVVKIPHLGRVMVGDDVEIGANSVIDRGSAGDTVIGRGTMIDNLVHISHNCVVGNGCAIAAQCGIAGSTVLGDYVVMGGQVGVAGHLTIGDSVQIAGKAMVTKSVSSGQKIGGGLPAGEVTVWRRQVATFRRLSRKLMT